MKITYPEFQLEISVDELIELNDHYETQIQCLPPELPGLKPVDFKHFGLIEEAKKWMDETLKDSIKKINEQLLAATDPARRGAGLVPLIKEDPEPIPYPQQEEDPAPTYEPGGIIGNGESQVEGEKVLQMHTLPEPVKKAIAKAKPKRKKNRRGKKIDVLFGKEWKTFDSASEAAKAIGVNYKTFYAALSKGKPVKGHQLRYSTDVQEQPEPSSEKPEENP
jgi:hypothetical protein